MRKIPLFVAALLCAGIPIDDSFGAGPGTGSSPQTQPITDGAQNQPIADSPPPPVRNDLGAVIAPTITLTARAPRVADRASLRVEWTSDVAGWSSNPTPSISVPLPKFGASFFARAGNDLNWPVFALEKNLPEAIAEKVHTAMVSETDPAKLDELASSIEKNYGKAFPGTLAALRAKAASIRAWPKARRVPFSSRLMWVDFPSLAKAQSSVVNCHFVHTGGNTELAVRGTSLVNIPNRAGKWVEAGRDSRTPASAMYVINATASDQYWMVDRCQVTGYAKSPIAAPISPASGASIARAPALPRAAALPPMAAAPLGEASVESTLTVSAQTPTIAKRAFLSAAWRAQVGGTVGAGVDATNNKLWVAGSNVAFDLVVDVYRQLQRTEVVACEIANAAGTQASVAGQAIPANASRWVEIKLPPVDAPVWNTAKFSAAGSEVRLTTRGCRISVLTASSTSVPSSRALAR